MKLPFAAIVLIVSIVSTGIMAGIFFTWANAVMPGLGRLSDVEYLRAFQSMNRAILNPLFFAVFFLPVFTIPVAAMLTHGTAGKLQWMCLVAAAVLYLVGCVGVTMFGNVPLNEQLDHADLTALAQPGTDGLRALRTAIELKWNVLNLIRTVATAAAFCCLVIAGL